MFKYNEITLNVGKIQAFDLLCRVGHDQLPVKHEFYYTI